MKVKSVLFVSIFLCLVYYTKAVDFGNLGDLINRQVQEQIGKMNVEVQKDLKEIKNLGPDIDAEIHKGLQPVNALDIRSRMAKGMGGITVAEYGGKFTLLIKNGLKLRCPGDIIADSATKTARCTKPLSTLNEHMKICAADSYSRASNMFCIGRGSKLSCLNNSCQCQNGKLFTLSALKRMCGDSFGTSRYVKFMYFPKRTDPNHVPIPHSNKFVTCEEGIHASFKCTWHAEGEL